MPFDGLGLPLLWPHFARVKHFCLFRMNKNRDFFYYLCLVFSLTTFLLSMNTQNSYKEIEWQYFKPIVCIIAWFLRYICYVFSLCFGFVFGHHFGEGLQLTPSNFHVSVTSLFCSWFLFTIRHESIILRILGDKEMVIRVEFNVIVFVKTSRFAFLSFVAGSHYDIFPQIYSSLFFIECTVYLSRSFHLSVYVLSIWTIAYVLINQRLCPSLLNYNKVK